MTEGRNAFGKNLSRGMIQRVVLAKTLIPEPRILLLDEPASSMDPLARINLKNILLNLSKQGLDRDFQRLCEICGLA
jgi:ABC-2 type transport system ATP-binding protein